MTISETSNDGDMHMFWWGLTVAEATEDREPLWTISALCAAMWKINDLILEGRDSPGLVEIRETIMEERWKSENRRSLVSDASSERHDDKQAETTSARQDTHSKTDDANEESQ